jgi:hypothetical protein
MRWIKAGWKQFKGQVKQGWGRLTRSALTTLAEKRARINRQREHLQKTYAVSAKELDDFTKSLETQDTAYRV